MRILIISVAFLPRSVVGAKRFAFIGEQLERRGHQVETNSRRIRKHEPRDPSLPQPGLVHWAPSILPRELPGRGLLARIHNRLVARILGGLDKELGWLRASLLTGFRICKRHRADIITATAPTLSAFLAGAVLSGFYGIPLVLDYRDPLTAYDRPSGNEVQQNAIRLRSRLEQGAVRNADAAVFCSELIRGPFEVRLNDIRDIRPGFLAVITNGFNDPEVSNPGCWNQAHSTSSTRA